MKKVRVGLIGAGGMANRVHYPSLAEFADVEMAALCDLDEKKLRATADKFHVERAYTDYKKMLAEVDPEAVYILMPPHHLFDLVIECLNQKRHVFIEKPPGVTREQTRNMALAAEKNGCLTMVGFNRRYIPLIREARRRVDECGPMLQCVSTFYKSSLGARPYFGGAIDVLTCDAVHAVDMLRYMGGEPARVASDVRSLHAAYDNSFNALIRFESGCAGVLLTNWVVGRRVHTFEMHAKGISAFIDGDDKAIIHQSGQEDPLVLDTRAVAGSSDSRTYYGFAGENRHFIDCIQEGHQPETCFADAVKTMELVERIYRSQI
ncbi:MAG: Gfo/Idh/MocA family oxidoreductase [Armatimonadetes bacterium]|nr:Gfo/Idh/MocA family oxidoreductase [Armatimonadota bacterium]